MKQRLNQEFFPFVVKPGRYSGGEPGEIVKSPENRISYLHAYPDKYEIGMSYIGLQTIYHIVNADDRFLCERLFAVDNDAEEILRKKSIPLFSLESSRPIKEFDAIGFTLVDETVYTNLLNMLNLGTIPLQSKDRTDDDPLIFAGGPSVFNPEPVADFIDLFFIGDAEEGLPEILSILDENRALSRKEKLEKIVQNVTSVYVPEFYDDNLKPIVEFAPTEIHSRVIPELKPDYYPSKPLLPLIETVHNHLGVEIMRGCPQGCRFCMAGHIYRPVRVRSQKEILNQVDEQLQSSGYSDVTLLSLSSSDYPDIEQLASTLARRLEPQKISLSLPSLRPGTITPTLLDAIGKVRKSGLTIAPEAGTERLRLFIRKDFPDAAIYDTVRIALRRGWRTIKLYFMIGLPTETETDLLGIVHICNEIVKISREFEEKTKINVTLSPFTPKPNTPFQWDEIVVENEMFKRISFIKRNTRSSQIQYKFSDTRLAMICGILGRGSRKHGQILEEAYKLGCRFDGWSECFDFDKWTQAFDSASVDIESELRPIPFSTDLPWSHIKKGVSVEHLQSERQRTSASLKEFEPQRDDLSVATSSSDNQRSFGRGKKKVASKNLIAPTKNRVRLRWGKKPAFRFMSHLDNLRMIERLIRQAKFPVAYSQGYNPTMKLSFGPPLPLGHTSSSEYLDITLEASLQPNMVNDLKIYAPDAFELFDAKTVLGKSKSLNAVLNRVIYLSDISGCDSKNLLQDQIDTILNKESLEVERIGKKETKLLDIRSAIYDISIQDDTLLMVLGLGDGGYVKPGEVLKLLTKDLTINADALTFHRQEMFRLESDGKKIDPMEL